MVHPMVRYIPRVTVLRTHLKRRNLMQLSATNSLMKTLWSSHSLGSFSSLFFNQPICTKACDLLLGTKTTSFLKGKGISLCPSFSYIFSAFCIKRCSSCDISIVSLATVKVLYHVLKLGVNFDKGAYSLRSMATTSQKTVHCSTDARS